MLAIAAKGVKKTYGRFCRGQVQALNSVDLEIPRGIAFGLIGPNGAGKTTFVKTLLGIVELTQGQLNVLGGGPKEIGVRARIGYVPERLALPASWTAKSFLESVARLKRLRGAGVEISEKLSRVGLGAQAEHRIGQFSKGMRQRLALAAALLGKPDLLILDEPTDGVDPLGRAEIRRILTEERQRGATLLVNSHLLSETERMCDRIGILSRGAILREGSISELCGQEGTYKVRFVEGAACRLEEFGFLPQDDGSYRCRATTPSELDQLLAAARTRGALLIELRSDLRDLEEVMAEVVGS